MSESSKPGMKYDRSRPKTRPFVLLAAIPLPVLAGIGAALWSLKTGTDPHAAEFVAYAVEEQYRLAPKTPDLNGRGIPEPFKPFIVNDARHGPNFAGVYTVVPYELANGARTVLVISARTGAVHTAPPATGFMVRYRLDSRLLIYEPDATEGQLRRTAYYVFSGKRFIRVPKPPTPERPKRVVGGKKTGGRRTKH